MSGARRTWGTVVQKCGSGRVPGPGRRGRAACPFGLLELRPGRLLPCGPGWRMPGPVFASLRWPSNWPDGEPGVQGVQKSEAGAVRSSGALQTGCPGGGHIRVHRAQSPAPEQPPGRRGGKPGAYHVAGVSAKGRVSWSDQGYTPWVPQAPEKNKAEASCRLYFPHIMPCPPGIDVVSNALSWLMCQGTHGSLGGVGWHLPVGAPSWKHGQDELPLNPPTKWPCQSS